MGTMRLAVSILSLPAVTAVSIALVACSSSNAVSPTDAGNTKDAPGNHEGGKPKDSGSATADGGRDAGHDGGRDAGHDGGRDAGHGDDAGDDASTGGPCAPTASCAAADKSCLGLVDNATKTPFGLRVSQLTVQKPTVFATGVGEATLSSATLPDGPSCNLDGTGTFSWLLQFDTTAGTLKTGGAKPVADPTMGYSFDDEMIVQGTSTFHVTPATLPLTQSSGAFMTSVAVSLDLPVFLDQAGTSVLLLPLQMLSVQGTVTSDNDCIGSYNANTLDPANACQPASGVLSFANGGTGTAFIALSDADNVAIASINESLCVFLSNNPTLYGVMQTGSTETVCKRDASGNIVFQGDWCAATNSAASAVCADSVAVSFAFAASSILINN
jgi:hypothetical protein